MIIQPTGEEVDGLPEMEVLSDTTTLYRDVMHTIQNSFVNEFLDLYFLAQFYLRNQGRLENIEPAYLGLTENQGGFAKFGFSLSTSNGQIPKPDVPYIDITVNSATTSPDRLMSFTQLYPHEMGHVFVHLLTVEDSIENNTKNVDMHFFSVVTDFSTAFNEGFAEHIENVSRFYEKNEVILEGIGRDMEEIEQNSPRSIRGFERDFKIPLRLGYYKASMLSWYQRYEDFKRYRQAFDGDVKYKPRTLALRNIEDRLTYRNSGVRLDKTRKRNLVQLLATEGAASAFFSQLTTSDLSNRYQTSQFYQDFLFEMDSLADPPQNYLLPWQNQFLKYFKVLSEFVIFNNSNNSQFTDFIDGYLKLFPDESSEVLQIFRSSLGIDYTNDVPPPLWLMVDNYDHRLLTFDPFGAITVPLYTFDLNAAEIEDLLTINGIGEVDAERLIEYRDRNGFFETLEEVREVSGLSTATAEKVIESALDTEELENLLGGFEPQLSVVQLIAKPLQYMFSRALIYFLILFAVAHFYFRKLEDLTPKTKVGIFIRQLILALLLTISGFLMVFVSAQALLYFLLLDSVVVLMIVVIYRKKPVKKQRTLGLVIGMSMLIIMSIL